MYKRQLLALGKLTFSLSADELNAIPEFSNENFIVRLDDPRDLNTNRPIAASSDIHHTQKRNTISITP